MLFYAVKLKSEGEMLGCPKHRQQSEKHIKLLNVSYVTTSQELPFLVNCCFCSGSLAVSKLTEAQSGVWNVLEFRGSEVSRAAVGEIVPNEGGGRRRNARVLSIPSGLPRWSFSVTNSSLLLLFFFICGRLEEFVTKPWLQNSAEKKRKTPFFTFTKNVPLLCRF